MTAQPADFAAVVADRDTTEQLWKTRTDPEARTIIDA